MADDTLKPFKSRADVHMERESQAASFAKRRCALQLQEEDAPTIPVPALEKTNKLAWVLTYLAHRIGFKEPLPTYDAAGDSGIYPLPLQTTLALYGDWASGTQVADTVAGHIRARRPDTTIHMGDIYFVGDEDEARENFLGVEVPGSPFRAVAYPAGTQRSFAMNGNHEMYARGRGYFRHVLPALGQRSSFFALENEHWRVLALDSGYHSITWPFWELIFKPDCHLPDAVVDWLKTTLKTNGTPDPRGTIILTHHQPFSYYEAGFPRLIEQIAQVLGGPVLWLWGHEHWLSIYAPVEASGMTIHGRCIGHAGMPCEPPGTDRNPQYPIRIEDHRILDAGAKVVLWPNGYAMLSFDGPALRIDYRDVKDDLVAHEAWAVSDGRLTPVIAPTADVAGVGPPL